MLIMRRKIYTNNNVILNIWLLFKGKPIFLIITFFVVCTKQLVFSLTIPFQTFKNYSWNNNCLALKFWSNSYRNLILAQDLHFEFGLKTTYLLFIMKTFLTIFGSEARKHLYILQCPIYIYIHEYVGIHI